MQNKLYVGNLAGDVAASSLQELFEPHGFVIDVKLPSSERVNPRRGFAVVTMALDAAAREAMRALDGTSLHGMVITVKLASRASSGETP